MLKQILYIAIIGTILYSCANRGYPEGGPKDEIPPLMIGEDPVSFSTNFSQKKLKIYFNEFIQLKDVNSNLMVSPPLKKKPTVSNRGKYIVVDFSRDTLKENTTYNLDFGSSIVDNNEGNPLGYYRYVFSTGQAIDTMELGGQVVDAESGEPLLKVLVALYKKQADSIPLTNIPDYVALTDSSGHFRITNIQDSSYRLIAFSDDNTDYKFLPESEQVGFIDTLIHPVMFATVKRDTFFHSYIDSTKMTHVIDSTTIDSIIETPYNAYGPANLFVRLFLEEKTQNYMESPKRVERDNFTTIFAIKEGGKELKLSLTDSLLNDTLDGRDWYFIERNKTIDTLKVWLTDTLVSRRDTLSIVFEYLKQDSLKQLVLTMDTIRMNYKPTKEKYDGKRKLSHQDSLDMLYTSAKFNVRKSLDIYSEPSIIFDKPINYKGVDSIRLEIKKDSIFERVPINVVMDSTSIRQFNIHYNYKQGATYKLTLDTASIFDIYGKPVLGTTTTFKVKEEKDYGNLSIVLRNTHNRPILVQLYPPSKSSSSSKKSSGNKSAFKIAESKATDHDGTVKFELLKEGKYMIRAVIDENRNGKWDTGLYLKRIQPESIIYQFIEINVKANFDIEQTFDLDKEYPRPIVEKTKSKNSKNSNSNR